MVHAARLAVRRIEAREEELMDGGGNDAQDEAPVEESSPNAELATQNSNNDTPPGTLIDSAPFVKASGGSRHQRQRNSIFLPAGPPDSSTSKQQWKRAKVRRMDAASALDALYVTARARQDAAQLDPSPAKSGRLAALATSAVQHHGAPSGATGDCRPPATETASEELLESRYRNRHHPKVREQLELWWRGTQVAYADKETGSPCWSLT